MSLSQSLSSLVSLSFTIYYINLFVALQWWIFVQLHQRPISWTKVTWRIPELTRCHLTYYWLHNATVHTWKCWRSCQTSQNLHCPRFCSESEWINESKRVCFCCSKAECVFHDVICLRAARIDPTKRISISFYFVQFVSDLLHKLDKMATLRSKSNPSNTNPV